METITVLGIDLAKEVFQLHGVNKRGMPVLKKCVKRNKLIETIAQLPPCLVGVEACGGSNYWAREFRKYGHDVKVIPPQFVKPYVKTNKNDAADAEAICEAVSRPNMRFVPIKEVAHQDLQSIHRIRERLVRSRTALANEVHGLLLEYGIVISKLRGKLKRELASLIAPEASQLGSETKEYLSWMLEELTDIEGRIAKCDDKIQRFCRSNELCQRLQTIPGVGVITASAILAAVPDVDLFKNGRQFSAWLGLVPKQCSSGGRQLLLGISKRGDSYLRTLLVHGGRSVLRVANRRTDRLSQWALEKQKTRGTNRAVVALANKNARIIWAILKTQKEYQPAQLAQAA